MKIIPSVIGKLFSGKAYTKEVTAAAKQIDPTESIIFGGPSIAAPGILANADARSRDQIYAKWAEMAACPIIHAAAKLQTTSALGGHETTGDIVFIEPRAGVDKTTAKLVEDVSRQLSPLLNRHVYALSYTGFNYGDAYARLYTEQGAGVVDMRTDSFVRPELVLPYEQGNTTVGFVLASLREVHPRWRGEQEDGIQRFEMELGSSPLARGTAVRVDARLHRQRFIPAGAGNRRPRHDLLGL